MRPRRVRPNLPPEWHVPNDPKKWITWKHADKKLTTEKVYWISTSSKDGKPHAAPVWGIWEKKALYFETGPSSPKGRNLRTNPRAIVHVQDGMDTVLIEGIVERERNSRKLAWLVKEYFLKYDYKPDWTDEKRNVVFRVKPRVIHAWKAPRMHRSLVKFIF